MRRLLAGLVAAVTLSLAACSSTATPAPTSGTTSITDPASAVSSPTPSTQPATGASSSSVTSGVTSSPPTPPSGADSLTAPSSTPPASATSSATPLISTTPSPATRATAAAPTITVTIPSTITGANRKAATEGIAAWRNAVHVFDLSLQDPSGKNWKAAIYKYANDPAAALQLNLVDTFVKQKIHQVGFLHYDATVIKSAKDNVQIRACVDDRAADVVDQSGHSASGSGADRFMWTFNVTWYPNVRDGQWLLNYITKPGPVTPC